MWWAEELADWAVAWGALLMFGWAGLRSDPETVVGLAVGQMATWGCLAVAGYAGWRAVRAGRQE